MQANITVIPGLTVWDLPVHGDNRGWFKQDWQLVIHDVDTMDQELRLLAAVRSRVWELGGNTSGELVDQLPDERLHAAACHPAR